MSSKTLTLQTLEAMINSALSEIAAPWHRHVVRLRVLELMPNNGNGIKWEWASAVNETPKVEVIGYG